MRAWPGFGLFTAVISSTWNWVRHVINPHLHSWVREQLVEDLRAWALGLWAALFAAPPGSERNLSRNTEMRGESYGRLQGLCARLPWILLLIHSDRICPWPQWILLRVGFFSLVKNLIIHRAEWPVGAQWGCPLPLFQAFKKNCYILIHAFLGF